MPNSCSAMARVTTSASVTTSLGVLSSRGQEIVGGAEHRNEQRVDVGVHRGPSGSSVRASTDDFDPAAYVTSQPPGPIIGR